MSEDEERFHQAFQRIKFTDNDPDCFSNAQTKRQMLLLNFYGSIFLQENEAVTEFLLNDALSEYAKVVDNQDPGNVNNYADYVLALLSNFQNDDRKNWKTSLEDFNVREEVSKLSCSNNINCKASSGRSENLEYLEKAFEEKEAKEKVNNFKSLFKTETKPPPTHPPPNQTSQRSKSENAIFEAKTVKQNYIPFHKKDPIHVPQSNVEEPERPPGFNAFRTARDELQIQNAKKFGKGSNHAGNDKTLNYGVVKKSLGTRKGGVFNKFQPPLKSKGTRNDLEDPITSMDVDEVVDERLKNIDPAMIELIKNEIMDCGSKITWDDIAGLHLAKTTIQEIVVWPMLRPDIFTGLRRPPKGILLFGPPGTGKTLIGKCIASQSNSTFFSISASSLTSKWVGDGEKMVRTLFAVAKVYQPSVVFIDEIDSLLSQRSDSEHECSRRIKTEFLVQLDGAGTGDEDRILIIGATNRPQELDEAARRRLVKRLYIPLPDEDARKQIIQHLISSEKHSLSEGDIDSIAKLTKGYSGADVKNLCQEASLGPIRSIAPSMIQSINTNDVRPLDSKDFESALCRIKSSVSEKDLDTYVAWDKQYGCGSVPSIQ